MNYKKESVLLHSRYLFCIYLLWNALAVRAVPCCREEVIRETVEVLERSFYIPSENELLCNVVTCIVTAHVTWLIT